MSLMKSSEGKSFSGELRIFISHTRNLTCRLVGSGNLSHEIVLLRVASSPAAFRNYLMHRLPLDRLPSVEMHLLPTKSVLLPLPTSHHSWCGSPAATKGSSSSQEPRSPLPGAWILGKCNYISSTGWLCRCGAHRTCPQLNRVCLTEPPGAPGAQHSPTAPHQDTPSPGVGIPAHGAFFSICFCAWGGLAGAALCWLTEEGQIWGSFYTTCCWAGMFQNVCPPVMHRTWYGVHTGPQQAFKVF